LIRVNADGTVQKQAEHLPIKGSAMKKNLVVYYSRTGNTRILAQWLAEWLDADIEELTEQHERKGRFGDLRSLFDVMSGHEPLIGAPKHDPRHYRRVIVGSPVWADHVASPVRTYLVEHAEKFRQVAFFCTCANSGVHALSDMASLCDREPDASLIMTDRQVADGKVGLPGAFLQALHALDEARDKKPKSQSIQARKGPKSVKAA
jgi:flavodoxin